MRDRDQRTWQIDQDNLRWFREGKERQSQWDREDATRWRMERYGVYQSILATAEEWEDVARRAKIVDRAWGKGFAAEDDAALNAKAQAVNMSVAAVELLGTEPVIQAARKLYISLSAFRVMIREKPEESITAAQERERLFNAALKRLWAFRDAARAELGISAPLEP